MRSSSYAAGGPAVLPQARLGPASAAVVANVHADGLDLDDPRGAEVAFAALADEASRLPLPGGGSTPARFASLAAVASVDVTLGRLLEAHADAVAILAELGARDPETAVGQRWAVWAAEGPAATVRALRGPSGVELVGMKPWCSGAMLCTHALVTAESPDGRRLYATTLDPERAKPGTGTWQAVGMTGSTTETVEFAGAAAVPVGLPGSYLTRPGFWHGAIGVAAVWWGAAAGIAAPMYAAVETGKVDSHGLAHLGAVEADLASSGALLREAAAKIDRAGHQAGQRLALTVRAAVEKAATDVVDRVGRALGPAPLCQDRPHARRVADLTVYLRQSHAERDLESLAMLTDGAPSLDAS